MSDTPIAILSYNHPELTARCISSALRLQAPKRIYLLHNGSRRECVASLTERFPEIEHLILAENRGFAGGANHLIRTVASRHDWVLFVTNDCELLRIGQAPPVAGLYAPLIRLRKTAWVDSLGGAIDLKRARLAHCRSELEWRQAEARYVPGTAFLVDRETFSSLGGFDETLHTYWEDVDFSLRVQMAGIAVGIRPDFELRHAVGKTCHKDSFYTTYLYQRNRRIVMRRHRPNAGLLSWSQEWHLHRDYVLGSLRLAKLGRWSDIKWLHLAHWRPTALDGFQKSKSQ